MTEKVEHESLHTPRNLEGQCKVKSPQLQAALAVHTDPETNAQIVGVHQLAARFELPSQHLQR